MPYTLTITTKVGRSKATKQVIECMESELDAYKAAARASVPAGSVVTFKVK